MKNKYVIILVFVFSLIFIGIFTKNASAQQDIQFNVKSLEGPTLGTITARSLISAIVNLLLIATGLLSFIFLVLGGVKWITSGGDPKAVAAAREQITAAIIGLFIALLSFAIINLIGQFFGVSPLNIKF